MLLRLLAEAVNCVADFPWHDVWVDDSPIERCLGYRIGETQFRYRLVDVKRGLPEVEAKKRQLEKMVSGIPLPLRAYPDQQREREMLVRCSLLRAAVHLTNVEMRKETARWIMLLGRLRFDPSGQYLYGGIPNHEGFVEPQPRQFFL